VAAAGESAARAAFDARFLRRGKEAALLAPAIGPMIGEATERGGLWR
jgi:hypothetical protein